MSDEHVKQFVRGIRTAHCFSEEGIKEITVSARLYKRLRKHLQDMDDFLGLDINREADGIMICGIPVKEQSSVRPLPSVATVSW